MSAFTLLVWILSLVGLVCNAPLLASEQTSPVSCDEEELRTRWDAVSNNIFIANVRGFPAIGGTGTDVIQDNGDEVFLIVYKYGFTKGEGVGSMNSESCLIELDWIESGPIFNPSGKGHFKLPDPEEETLEVSILDFKETFTILLIGEWEPGQTWYIAEEKVQE